ncbi:MAG: hypothetical protein JNK38_24160 [Acidobacteria bacterium]|nr:hypothetical protein [Acidobacteriota bacterium]
MKKIFFALTIACALAISAAAHDGKKHDNKQAAAKGKTAKAEFAGKGDGVETCPVTGEPITNKDIKAQMFGRTVYFCCAGCLEDAKKNPAMYVKKTHKEQLAAIKNVKPSEHGHHGEHQDKAASGETKFLGKGDGIETCPVTGEPVNKNLKHEVDGKTFYVCCDGCADTVKKNPSAYLKGVTAKVAFMGKGDGVETCPVTGEPVNKNLKHEVDGQTFYVCCDGCADTVKKNPAAYLKKASK